MNSLKVYPIGKIANENGEMKIILDPEYREGLMGLEGFGHVQVLWWADKCNNYSDTNTFVEEKPYKSGPESLCVFAIRSPQ